VEDFDLSEELEKIYAHRRDRFKELQVKIQVRPGWCSSIWFDPFINIAIHRLRQRWNRSSMLLAWTMPMNLNSWLHDGEVVVLAY